jgi:hypothetical protein
MSYSNALTLIALCLSASIGAASQSRAANSDGTVDSVDSSTSSVASGAVVVAASANATTAPSSAASTSGSLSEVVIVATRLNAERSGIETQTGATVTTIDAAAIAAMPGGGNVQLNQIMLQAPDVAQDSFGQIHVRGDHNDLQYRLNGIILPEGISVFSQTLDPRLISSMSLITGALPAEYGLRTAGIIDLTTRSGLLEPGGSVSLYGGSHSTIEPSAWYAIWVLNLPTTLPNRCMITRPNCMASATSRTLSIRTIACRSCSVYQMSSSRFRTSRACSLRTA